MAEATGADCVVVGGGIGGAVLALALGRLKHSVVVLEREAAPPTIGRPEVLAQATMDVFERIGALGPILREAAVPLQSLEMWHGPRKVLRISRDILDAAGAHPNSTDPGRTRQILLDRALATGAVRLERGVEVHGLLREGAQVVGVEARRGGDVVQWRGRLIVGDDGTGSRLRAGLGIRIDLQEFPLEFLATAGPALPGLPQHVGQAWIRPEGFFGGLVAAIGMPLPSQRTAMVFLATPSACDRLLRDPGAFYAQAARMAPVYAALPQHYRFPDQFTRIRRPFGHAARYVSNGAALLGDAAHPVTPVGGQGANMSVADAMALATVAHEALQRGACTAEALRPYERMRRPANERALEFSRRGRRAIGFLCAVPPAAWLLPMRLRRFDANAEAKIRLARSVSQAFRSIEPPVRSTV